MGTDTGRPEEPAYEAPCRAAARYRTACPLCGRRVTNKVLRYSHKCGRSFFPAVRAAEQRLLAEAAIKARMALEPTLEPREAFSGALSRQVTKELK